MKGRWILMGHGERLVRLTRLRSDGRANVVISPVLTVNEVSRRLHRSQRQVYRYLRTGRLIPCQRILGQWLFTPAALDRFAADRVPATLRPLFWDAELSSVSLDRHRDFICARVLERGDWKAIGWLLQTYPRSQLRAFLSRRGHDLLSTRAWRFWAVQLGLTAARPARPSWRARGRRWGGAPRS